MKKLITSLILIGTILTLTACGNSISSDNGTNKSGNETTSGTLETENDPIVKGEWGIYVGFKPSESTNITPHKEMIYSRTYHDHGDGTGNVIVSNGPLMFYNVNEYLSSFADKIPTVAWSEDFKLVYLMDEDITYKGGENFSVYDEDYTELAKRITLDELIQKSKNEWKGKTVYLEFSGVFYHKISEEITEDISNTYFVKTGF